MAKISYTATEHSSNYYGIVIYHNNQKLACHRSYLALKLEKNPKVHKRQCASFLKYFCIRMKSKYLQH